MQPNRLLGSLSLALALLGCSPCLGATSIGVNFQGRGSDTSNPATTPLDPTMSAGVVPQANWNNVDDAYGYTPANVGDTGPLTDQTGAATTVSLHFQANDSWYNDVAFDAVTNGNAILMNGIIKISAGGGVPGYFTFSGVPDGQYDLYVYMNENGDNAQLNISDATRLHTFYVTETHQFYNTNSFIQASNTDPNGTRDVGNYVKFSNLSPYVTGQLGVIVSHFANSDGVGIAGLQLVNVGPAVVNTNPVSIIAQPYSRRVLVGDTNVVMSVTTMGPTFSYQWYKNSLANPISGATSSSYSVPAITAGDDGAVFFAVVTNNVNSAQSANAKITLGHSIKLPGLALEQRYAGETRATIEDPAFAGTPDVVRQLASFEVPVNQADSFGETLEGLFLPPVTGDYVFFVCSDDDSDLFLSSDATPANKVLIAQETTWSNNQNWTGSDGGSTLTQKRSDKFQVDPANPTTPPPFASGIHLVAGTPYYIEGVHHEGTGGDDFSANYKLIGDPDPVNSTPTRIAGFALGAFTEGLDGAQITVTNPPANTLATQSLTATLTIGATTSFIGDTSPAKPGLSYQWQMAPKGSTAFTDIAFATASSYTTPVLKLSDDGNQYRVHLLAGDANMISDVGTLSVAHDTTPPMPVTVNSVSGDRKTVTVTFNELMDKASSEAGANYTFTPGNIAGATASLDSSTKVVAITAAAPLTPEVENTLTISGVKDLAGNPVVAGTFIKFTFKLVSYQADILFDGPIAYYRFEETSGTVAHNDGSKGGNGVYSRGDEPAAMAGGIPSPVVSGAGPRPPAFAGFEATNNAPIFDGALSTDPNGAFWVDTTNQFLQGLGAFSLEYWVKPHRTNDDGSTWGNRIGLVGQNDAIEYGFVDPATIQIWTPNGGSLNTTYSFPDDEWHHVATIASGTDIRNYFDGVLQNSTTANANGNYGTSGYNVHIGGGGVFDAVGNYFQGQFDEVAIFDKAIPADRIAAHFAAGKSGGVITTSGAVGPQPTSLTLTITVSGGNATISWTGTGTLQSTPTLNGAATVWTDGSATSPATVPIGAGNSFYRVKQ